jgi:CheY-like chemotaxis protein
LKKGSKVMNELILVVEDNELNAKLVRDFLGAMGYRVIESTMAETGLQMAREQGPDLILMDIRLPGMDGVSALRELKRDPATQQIPVMAVTASVMPSERDECLTAGFDGYHAKPINVKGLLEEMRALLGEGPGNRGG